MSFSEKEKSYTNVTEWLETQSIDTLKVNLNWNGVPVFEYGTDHYSVRYFLNLAILRNRTLTTALLLTVLQIPETDMTLQERIVYYNLFVRESPFRKQ